MGVCRNIVLKPYGSVDEHDRDEVMRRLSLVAPVSLECNGDESRSANSVVVHYGLNGILGFHSSLDFYIDSSKEITCSFLAKLEECFQLREKRVLLFLGKFPAGNMDQDGGSQLARQLIDVLKKNSCLDVTFIRKAWDEYNDKFVNKVRYVPYIDPRGNKFKRRLKNLSSNREAILNGCEYDVVVAAHCSKLFGLTSDSVMEKAIIFPMFLTQSYVRSGEMVPHEYTECEREVLEKVSAIITPSADEMNDIENYYAVDRTKISVVPRGVDAGIRPMVRTPESVRLISIGSIKKQKNHVGEIEVVRQLQSWGIPATLTIVGDIYDKDEYRKILNAISNYGLKSFVKHKAGLSRKEIVDVLASHTFGISTSRWETFGRGIFECLSSGLPTVLSDSLKTVHENLKGNLGAIFCSTPLQMAGVIRDLFENQKKYRHASIEASRVAMRFSTRVESERLLYSILVDRFGYESEFTSWLGSRVEKIYDGRYSFCLRRHERVRKYIRFDNREQVEREFCLAKRMWMCGVNTPRPRFVGWDCRFELWYIEFDYLGGVPIKRFSDKDCAEIKGIISAIQELTEVCPYKADMKNFEAAIVAYGDKFNLDINQDLEELYSMSPTEMVHGDLWTQNLGRGVDGRIVVYDFQSAALGPKGWDWCYVLANSHPSDFPRKQIATVANERSCSMIRLIHKIRIGRAIQKGNPIDELLRIASEWERAIA